MNRIDKPSTSRILANNIVYKIPGDNSELCSILVDEQKNVCAYTQARVTTAFSVNVEHFNPTIKGNDDYYNWFAVSTTWNLQKGSAKKWLRFQPILHPTDSNFEKRVIYKNGRYDWKDGDEEAEHLVNYLNLNQENLFTDRINHIKTLRLLLEKFGNDKSALKNYLINEDPNQIQYLRAIEEELGITF